jgi:hypothetical protein
MRYIELHCYNGGWVAEMFEDGVLLARGYGKDPETASDDARSLCLR